MINLLARLKKEKLDDKQFDEKIGEKQRSKAFTSQSSENGSMEERKQRTAEI